MREHNSEVPFQKKIVIFLAMMLVITTVAMLNKKRAYNENYQELLTRKSRQATVLKNNAKVLKQRQQQYKTLGNSEVIEETSTFMDLFFNWNSWEKYTKNMLQIQKLYPQIVDHSPVDISGNDVGTGDSPLSTYTSEFYTMDKTGKTLEMIQQVRNTPNTTTTTIWRGVTEVDEKNLFHLDLMDSYLKRAL